VREFQLDIWQPWCHIFSPAHSRWTMLQWAESKATHARMFRSFLLINLQERNKGCSIDARNFIFCDGCFSGLSVINYLGHVSSIHMLDRNPLTEHHDNGVGISSTNSPSWESKRSPQILQSNANPPCENCTGGTAGSLHYRQFNKNTIRWTEDFARKLDQNWGGGGAGEHVLAME
jgi:hypothetical protein